VQVPSNAKAIAEVGVQFTPSISAATAAYVDSLNW